MAVVDVEAVTVEAAEVAEVCSKFSSSEQK